MMNDEITVEESPDLDDADLTLLPIENDNTTIEKSSALYLEAVENESILDPLPVEYNAILLPAIENEPESLVTGFDVETSTPSEDPCLPVTDIEIGVAVIELHESQPTPDTEAALPVTDGDASLPVSEIDVTKPEAAEDSGLPVTAVEIGLTVNEIDESQPTPDTEKLEDGAEVTVDIVHTVPTTSSQPDEKGVAIEEPERMVEQIGSVEVTQQQAREIDLEQVLTYNGPLTVPIATSNWLEHSEDKLYILPKPQDVGEHDIVVDRDDNVDKTLRVNVYDDTFTEGIKFYIELLADYSAVISSAALQVKMVQSLAKAMPSHAADYTELRNITFTEGSVIITFSLPGLLRDETKDVDVEKVLEFLRGNEFQDAVEYKVLAVGLASSLPEEPTADTEVATPVIDVTKQEPSEDSSVPVTDVEIGVTIIEIDESQPSTDTEAALPVTDNDASLPVSEVGAVKPEYAEDSSRPVTGIEIEVTPIEIDKNQPTTDTDTALPTTDEDASVPVSDIDVSKAVPAEDLSFLVNDCCETSFSKTK